MFDNLKIEARLMKAFRIVAMIASIAAVLSATMMIISNNRYSNAMTNYGFSQGDIGKAMIVFTDARGCTRGVIGYDDENLIDEMIETRLEKKEKFEEYWKTVEKTVVSDKEKELYENINEHLEEYWEEDQKIVDLGKSPDAEISRTAQTMLKENVEPIYDEIYSDLLALLNENVDQGNSLSTTLGILSWIFAGIVIAVIIIAFFISTKLGRNIAIGIARPVTELAERFKTFATGDLASPFPEISTKDEVAQMIQTANEMKEQLREIISDAGYLMAEMAKGNYAVKSHNLAAYSGEFGNLLESMKDLRDQNIETMQAIIEAANQVSAGSANLAEGSQSLAEGATEQAGAVEELQATIANITSNIELAAKQADDAYMQAQKYADEADNSREEMQNMVDAMACISETSQKIGQIISEIEDIASQTNLLSLNASIEAARAGEAGRGFAVVADQIRQLAEQSTKAAVDTRELIEGSMREIDEGNKVADVVATSMGAVVDGIAKVAETSQNISVVSREQFNAMEQAEGGVNQISEVIQSVSATAEESSATSEELSAQAIALDDMVGKFILPE